MRFVSRGPLKEQTGRNRRWDDIRSHGLFPFPRGRPEKDCGEDNLVGVEFEVVDAFGAFFDRGVQVQI